MLVERIADWMALRYGKYQIKNLASLVLYGTMYKRKLDMIAKGQEVTEPPCDDDKNIPAQLISIASFERLSAKAREILRERATVTFAEARENSIGLYETLIRDESVSANAKIKAQENLDKIFGIVNVNDTTPEEIAAKAVAAMAAANGMIASKPEEEDDNSPGQEDTDSEMD